MKGLCVPVPSLEAAFVADILIALSGAASVLA